MATDLITYGDTGHIDWEGEVNEQLNILPYIQYPLIRDTGFQVITTTATKYTGYNAKGFNKVLMPYTSGWNGGTSTNLMSKQFNLAEYKAEMAHSKQDYKNAIHYWWNRSQASQNNDMTGMPLYRVEQDLFFRAVREDIWRCVLLGDTALMHNANGTYIDGTAFTSGTANKHYNVMDGILTQMVANSDHTETGGTYSYNDGTQFQSVYRATNTGISAFGGDEAQETMKLLLRNAHPVLRGSTDKVFLVTEKFFNDWQDTVTGLGTERAHNILENGQPVYRFDGVEVRLLHNIETWIADDITGATGTQLGGATGFCVLTTLSNLAIIINGTNNGTSVSETRFWFNPDANENRQRTQFMMDCGYFDPRMIAYEKCTV